MGFPTSMFTVLFALARTVGWIAQWKEMIEDPHQKLGRPRAALYRLAAARIPANFTGENNPVIARSNATEQSLRFPRDNELS